MQFHSKIITLIVVFAFIELNVANPIENKNQQFKHILNVLNNRSDKNAAKIEWNEIIKAARLAERQQPLMKRSVPSETDETESAESDDAYFMDDYSQHEQDSFIDYYDDQTTTKKVVPTTKKAVVTTPHKPVVTTKKAVVTTPHKPVVTTKKAVVTTPHKAVVTTKKPSNDGKHIEQFNLGTILMFTTTTFWLATIGR